jgi:hypothetical protein
MRKAISSVIASSILTVSFCSTLSAQTRRRPSPRAEKPAEAKRVEQSSLSIEAGLIYKSGDVKPVARTTFYLLDKGLGEILSEAGLKASDSTRLNLPPDMASNSPENLCFMWKLAASSTYDEKSKSFMQRAEEAMKPHLIQTVMTDFSGKAQFAPVTPGTYFVVGHYKPDRDSAAWSVKVELKSGQNSVTLDNNNAF